MRRDGLRLSDVYVDGVVNDWSALEAVWSYAFREHLGVAVNDHPLLVVEPNQSPLAEREKLLERAMESLHVPAIFLVKAAVAAAFAAGKSTALVVEAGAGHTCVTPVHEGYILKKGHRETRIGGHTLDLLTEQILFSSTAQRPAAIPLHPLFEVNKTFSSNGEFLSSTVNPQPLTHPSYRRWCQLNILKDIKETLCRVAESGIEASQSATSSSVAPASSSSSSTTASSGVTRFPSVEYELPDGRVLSVGNERFQIPEILFQPTNYTQPSQTHSALSPEVAKVVAHASAPDSPFTPFQLLAPTIISRMYKYSVFLCVFCVQFLSGVDPHFRGVQHLVLGSVSSVDGDLHRELYSNVVLCGGVALLPGMHSRLGREVSSLLSSAAPKLKVLIGSTTSDRKFAPWIGGSILASLGTFHQMWISKQEYDEQGPRCVHIKCP